jgi:hypothetical protein
VDAKNNMLTIGGAVRFGDLVGPLDEARKQLRELCVRHEEGNSLLTSLSHRLRELRRRGECTHSFNL